MSDILLWIWSFCYNTQYLVKVREELLQVAPPVSYSFAIVTHKSISTKKEKRGKKVH